MIFGSAKVNMVVNLIMTAIFLGLTIMMLMRWGRSKGKVKIKERQWSMMRMVFLVFGILAIISIVLNGNVNTIWDYMRLGSTLAAVTAYLVFRDGIGEEGVVVTGKFVPWNLIRAYDYEDKKNYFAAYVTVEYRDKNGGSTDLDTKEINFEKNNKNAVLKVLKNNIGRKYTRMRKY